MSLRPVTLLAVACLALFSKEPEVGAAAPATDVCTIAPGAVWSAAGSPYVATCDLVVPAGATLTIEPGVTVSMDAGQSFTIEGAIQAVGTATDPIRITAADQSRPWVGMILTATSGPSELGYVQFSDNGARRRALLEIHSDQANVHHSTFQNAGGVGVDVMAGASPTLTDSRFINAAEPNARSQGALRMFEGSRPTVLGNLFQSNSNYAVYQDWPAWLASTVRPSIGG